MSETDAQRAEVGPMSSHPGRSAGDGVGDDLVIGADEAVRTLRNVRAALAQRDDLVLIDPSAVDLLRTVEKIPQLIEVLHAVAALLSPHLHRIRQRQEWELGQDRALGKVVAALDGLGPVLAEDTAWQRTTLRFQLERVQAGDIRPG